MWSTGEVSLSSFCGCQESRVRMFSGETTPSLFAPKLQGGR